MECRRAGDETGTAARPRLRRDRPKPELVLRDAVSNHIEITKNVEHRLVYDRDIPATGLSVQTLIDWWRGRTQTTDLADREVGLHRHRRLEASLDNDAERQVFRAYGRRYGDRGFGAPAIVPQVYLHYDPYTARQRNRRLAPGPAAHGLPAAYSSRRRVVIEVDGRQHYADPDGTANTTLYAEMVAEDRRLRLAGYEVYRFGGKELDGNAASPTMLEGFFNDLDGRA